MKVIKKSIIKIALAFLLALLTILLCVFVGGYGQGNAVAETETESTPTSSITVSADKTELRAGDEFTLTVEISSTREDLYYFAFQLDLTFDNIVGNSSDGLVKSNFEFVSYKTNIVGIARVNFFDREDLGELAYRIYFTNYTRKLLANKTIVMTLVLKVKEDAQPVQSFDFGVAPVGSNQLNFYDGVDAKSRIDECANNPEQLAVNSIPMSIKPAESPVISSTVQLSSSKTELTAGDYFVLSLELSTARTDLTWNAINLTVGPLNEEGNPSTTISPYFEYVSHTVNIDISETCVPDFGDATAGYNQGLQIVAVTSGDGVPCTQKIVFAIILKVKDDAPAVQSFNFGIAPVRANYLSFSDGVMDAANSTLAINTIPMSIKAA